MCERSETSGRDVQWLPSVLVAPKSAGYACDDQERADDGKRGVELGVEDDGNRGRGWRNGDVKDSCDGGCNRNVLTARPGDSGDGLVGCREGERGEGLGSDEREEEDGEQTHQGLDGGRVEGG